MQKPARKFSVRGLLMGTTIAAFGAVALMGPVQGIAQSAPATEATSVAWTQPANLADLIEQVSPAVVKITATIGGTNPAMQQALPDNIPEGPMGDLLRRYFEQQQGIPEQRPRGQALGSGFIIDSSGIIVTNNHVVENASKLDVTLKDGREFEATLLGVDPKTDLAVLKIDAGKPLPSVQWGDSDKLRVGDPVFAVGAPFGLSGSVTAGIVSARGRDIGAGPYDDFIQVDAPINKGNSGGPLFDAEGHVVGVNTAIYSPTGGSVGIGFSIPSDLAKTIVSEIAATGEVHRGWLGVSIQNVTPDIADSLGLNAPEGALVGDVVPDSPAAKAGLKPGDVILSFNDKQIKDVGDLTIAVAEAEIGKPARMSVYRNGETLDLTPEIAALKSDGTAMAQSGGQSQGDIAALGLSLAAEGDHLLITGVTPGSESDIAGLQEGDQILSVNQRPVATLAGMQDQIRQAKDAGRRAVLLQIRRADGMYFVAVPLK